MTTAVHPYIRNLWPLILLKGCGELGVVGWYALDRSLGHHRADTQNHSHNLHVFWSVGGSRSFPYRKAPAVRFESRTFVLWGNSANHRTAVTAVVCFSKCNESDENTFSFAAAESPKTAIFLNEMLWLNCPKMKPYLTANDGCLTSMMNCWWTNC